ncbi:Agrin [Holothuria leucospilota]|uniref:Agrin n=1 Tax=Holothuria leucospilota TaxID=206669 RepID=A0A9Q0YTN2_HOLLE|nr:Agrin [Holothuria leucospilota]
MHTMKVAEITMLVLVLSITMFTATVSGQTSCNPACDQGVCQTTESGTASCACVRCWTGAACNVRIVSTACPSSATVSKTVTYRTGGGGMVSITRTGDQGSGTSTGTGTSGGSAESSTNPCSPNPCQGQGYCQVDSTSGARCTCVNGRTGSRCETVLATPRNPCLDTPYPCRPEQTCQPRGRDQIGVICT